MAVGAGKQFVEQEQNRDWAVGQVGNELDPVNFRIEAGNAAGERIETTARRSNGQRRKPEAAQPGPERRTARELRSRQCCG